MRNNREVLNMKCIINNIYDDVDKYEFIINSIKNVQKHEKLSDTYKFWGKDIVINHVAIDEHNVNVSEDSIWVSEYENNALTHECLIQLSKLETFVFTTEDDIEYYFDFRNK